MTDVPYEAAETLFAAAVGHHQAGRLDDAEAAYAALLCRLPTHAPSLTNLALLQQAAGRPAAALATLRRLTALRPDHPDGWFNLAALLAPADAVDALERALALRPRWPEARANRANRLRELGRLDEAEAELRAALAEAAGRADLEPLLLKDLGNVLAELGRPAAAIAALEAALARRPGFAEAENNLGTVLLLEHCHAVADGAAGTERLDAALDRFATAARLRPDWPEPAVSHASTLLLAGRWREGWPGYERRAGIHPPNAPGWAGCAPRWRGEPLGGRRILLWAEQGAGDIVQFARLVPAVAAAGGRVLLAVPPPMLPLLSTLVGVERLGAAPEDFPAPDLSCPLGSLPGVLGTSIGRIPGAVSYLAPPAARVSAWADRLAGPAPAVGLVWAGNPAFPEDRWRSPRLAAMRPLLAVPGIRWVSLQVGDGRRDLAAGLPPGVLDVGEALVDFGETAAALAHLDLVVTSDTSMAHLAGALGRPAWVLIPAVPDWRWLLGRADSPWYPSLRLFRQRRRGDWQPTIAAVADALRDWVVRR